MAQEIIIPEHLKKTKVKKSNNIIIPENLKKEPGFKENAYRTIAGALRDVAQSSVELGYDVVEYAKGTEFTKEQKEWLPEVPEPTYFGGSLIRDIAGFAVPYAGISKLGKVTKIIPAAKTYVGSATRATIVGAVAEQAAFSPEEQRLSNLIQSYPNLANPVTDYLEADPNDTTAQSRVKMALEGAGLGTAFDVVLGAARAFRSKKPDIERKSIEDIIKDKSPSDATLASIDETIDIARPIGDGAFKRTKVKFGDTEPSVTKEEPEVKAPSAETIKKAEDISGATKGTTTKTTGRGGTEFVEEGLPKFASNINLRRIDSDEPIKSVLDDMVKEDTVRFEKARGPKLNAESELLKLSDELGLDPDDFLKNTTIDFKKAPEYVFAARKLTTASIEDMYRSAVKSNNTKSPADYIEFQRSLERANSMAEQLAGITASWGRTGQAFKEIATGTPMQRKRKTNNFWEGARKQDVEEFARIIAKTPRDEITKRALNRTAKEWPKAKGIDKVQEVWLNALLSNPVTHSVNITSNALVSVWTIPERFLAAGISKITGKGKAGVTVREAVSKAFGTLEGFGEGLRGGARALRNEDFIDQFSKLDNRRPVIGGVGGKAVRMPFRFLSAEDQFFKGIGYRQELNSLAMRQALKENLSGRKLAARINQFKNADIGALNNKRVKAVNEGNIKLAKELEREINTISKIRDSALDGARYQTFTNTAGPIADMFKRLVTKYPATRFIVPFINTPANIITFALERTPAAPLLLRYKDAIKQGGADADIARAKMIMGTGVMSYVTYLGMQDIVTGRGPTDPAAYRIWRENHQPYSLRVGNEWIAYNRIEPLGVLFGLGADFAEIIRYAQRDDIEDFDKQMTQIASMLIFSFTDNITNKTFLTGISSVVDAVSDPERKGGLFINRFATSFIPRGIANIRSQMDPVRRDARSVLDNLRNQIPTLSELLPPRRNIFGYVQVYSGALGPKWVSPFYTSTTSVDPVFDALEKLELNLSMPSRNIRGVELSTELYSELLSNMRTLQTYEKINQIVTSPNYNNLNTYAKGEIIKRIIQKDQAVARALLMQNNPDLLRKSINQKIKKITN